MSKFIDAVHAKLTGQRVAIPPEINVTKHFEELPGQIDDALQYDIGVEWKVRTHCRPKDVAAVTENAVRQLREEIYGQFRRRALEIQRAAYERDYDKMHMHIRDLMREIQGHAV